MRGGGPADAAGGSRKRRREGQRGGNGERGKTPGPPPSRDEATGSSRPREGSPGPSRARAEASGSSATPGPSAAPGEAPHGSPGAAHEDLHDATIPRRLRNEAFPGSPPGPPSGSQAARAESRDDTVPGTRDEPSGNPQAPAEPKAPRPYGAPGGSHPAPRPRGGAPRFGPPLTPASLIGWTALSAFVPGAAHLRAGRRRTGIALLVTFGAALAALAVVAWRLVGNAGAVVRPSTLTAIMVGAAVCALAWFALVVLSFVALRPQRLSQTGQVVAGIVAGVLCVSVMAPFAVTAGYIRTASQTLDAVMAPVEGTTPSPIRAEDPWDGRKRVNFLLVGGDAAGNRVGVRTDSMTVASVNVATGNTVLFSLPRNLQYVRFPASSPLHKVFPDGFNIEGEGLLNSVWYYADNNPQVMGGKNRGAQALKDAIGYTLGLHIDYYAMVDMFGFAAMIDALGGLDIRVERDIKWGGHFGTAGTIRAGYRRLSGEEVLWYGRSRVDSDDFARMSRQRCVIGALAQQATPSKVLANFTRIAAAARHMFRTDIPRDLLEHLVPLGMKVRSAKITSLQFVPPLIHTGNPDWDKIRELTKKAIRESMADQVPIAATASPMVTAGASGTASASTSGSPGASPSSATSSTPSPSRTPIVADAGGRKTPTPNDKAAKTLAELCGF